MLHATRAGLDQIIVLARAADGSYHGLLAELPPGHWYVQVEADNRCGRIDAHSG